MDNFVIIQELLEKDKHLQQDYALAVQLEKADTFRIEANRRAALKIMEEEQDRERARERDYVFAAHLTNLERSGQANQCDFLKEMPFGCFPELAAKHSAKKSKKDNEPLCSICLLPMRITNGQQAGVNSLGAGVQLQPCLHTCCFSCIFQYVSTAVKEKRHRFPLVCPYFKCTTVLTPEDGLVALAMIQDGAQSVYKEFKKRHTLATTDAMGCPNDQCGNVIVLSGARDSRTQRVMCESCNVSFCVSCRVKWHEALTCRQFQKLPLEQRYPDDAEFMKLSKRCRWQRCPSCHAMIDRVDGCNHMTCRCGQQFCYKCSTPYAYSALFHVQRPKCNCTNTY
jgi:hypothetical protein